MPTPTLSAFYCCYLLRSVPKPLSLYIGSSPDPIRRLKQHNGVRIGGAVRTSQDTHRPWEIVCTISGFPTKTAALQFEWAWQNVHLTRKLRKQGMSLHEPFIDTAAMGKYNFKKKRRSRLTLKQQIRNALLLTESPTFRRLPLLFGFYHEDVHRFWRQVDSNHTLESHPAASFRKDVKSDYLGPVASSIGNEHVHLNIESCTSKETKIDENELPGLDLTYNRHIPALKFVEQTLLAGEDTHCQACADRLDLRKHAFTCCPNSQCRALYHVSCLAKDFLHRAGTLEHDEQLVPLNSICPTCQSSIQWLNLTIGSSFIKAKSSLNN